MLASEIDIDLVVLGGDMVSGYKQSMRVPGVWERTCGLSPSREPLRAAKTPHSQAHAVTSH